MGAFTAVTYADQPQEFLKCLGEADFEMLPKAEQFILESRYRRFEIGENFKDLSFALFDGGEVEAFILAHKFGDTIGFNGSGLEIIEAGYHKKRFKYILQHLLTVAADERCRVLKIDDSCADNMLSPSGQDIFNHRATPSLTLRAVQDLTLSEDEIFLNIRNSYRSLINKSKTEIDFVHVTSGNADHGLFDDFRAFHKETAGRQTRSIESWDVQFEMIKAGHAELIMGYMEPYGLVSSALFTDYGLMTSYAVAVYNRSLFDRPLAHANVYEGMLRAKKRGQKCFNLGIVPSYHPEREKEYNIGKFKKGFCRRLLSFVEWHVDIV